MVTKRNHLKAVRRRDRNGVMRTVYIKKSTKHASIGKKKKTPRNKNKIKLPIKKSTKIEKKHLPSDLILLLKELEEMEKMKKAKPGVKWPANTLDGVAATGFIYVPKYNPEHQNILFQTPQEHVVAREGASQDVYVTYNPMPTAKQFNQFQKDLRFYKEQAEK